MSVRDVVRRDLREALRTRGGIAAFLVVAASAVLPAAEILLRPILPDRSLFVLVVQVLLARFWRVDPGPVTTPDVLVVSVGTALAWTVPFVGLLVAYTAVLGERQRGTIRFLLGLPNTRLAVVLGKVIARSAVVVFPLAITLPALGFVAAPSRSVFVSFLGVLGYASLLAACFVAFGVAVSTLTTGGRRAISTALGCYIAFRVLWRVGQFGHLARSTGSPLPAGRYPGWFYLTSRLNPIHAAQAGVAAFVGRSSSIPHPLVAGAPPGSLYGADWLPAAVLVGWTVLAVAVGYARFRRTDLD